MIPSGPLSLYLTLFSPICLYAIYYAHWCLAIRLSRRRFIASKGCKPLCKWRNKDPFLGLDFLWASYRELKEHRALEMSKNRFDSFGANTVRISILTRTVVSTIEPENLRCILASDFKSYSLGDERKRLLRPLLGEGIFTTDGRE